MYRSCLVFLLTIVLTNSQLLTVSKSGEVGVNFGGYHASAGLGGVLNGDGTGGGLHAEAGTPFGPAAGAGLRGNVDGEAGSQGALYAGATSGLHHTAGAGLTVEKYPAVPIHKYVRVAASAPAPEKIEVAPAPQKVVFEKHVQVIASNKPQAIVPESAPVLVEKPVETYPVYPVKTVYRRPHHRRKYVYYNAGEQVVPVTKTKVVYSDAAPVYAPFPPPPAVSGQGVYSGTVAVNKNGNLFNDIFNIPISTLKAVNQLVNNIVGGATVSVTKHVGATGSVVASAEGHGSTIGHGSRIGHGSAGSSGSTSISASGSAEVHKTP